MLASKVSTSNPGIGLKMTGSRIQKQNESIGPGPHGYNVSFRLTDREKFQNELLSQRYKNWERNYQKEQRKDIKRTFDTPLYINTIKG